MVRTQIQLTGEQATAVRELAQREQRSVADFVQESIDARLRQRGLVDREDLKRRAVAVADEEHHRAAAAQWRRLVQAEEPLVASSYV